MVFLTEVHRVTAISEFRTHAAAAGEAATHLKALTFVNCLRSRPGQKWREKPVAILVGALFAMFRASRLSGEFETTEKRGRGPIIFDQFIYVKHHKRCIDKTRSGKAMQQKVAW
jgi:hypothetical protein